MRNEPLSVLQRLRRRELFAAPPGAAVRLLTAPSAVRGFWLLRLTAGTELTADAGQCCEEALRRRHSRHIGMPLSVGTSQSAGVLV